MNKVKVIVGATASGKTKRAIELAKTCNGEIINCDSLQVYKDLKILTAFPPDDEIAQVKHKLFGYLDYDQKSSAVEWAKLASAEIKNTLSSEKTPIIVGGTGFYVKTLVEGISPMPEISDENRKKAEMFSRQDFNGMCDVLYTFDPDLKNLLPMSMHHQLTRVYEILLETGNSIKYFWTLPKIKFIENIEFEYEIIHCERTKLYKRIEQRFEQMLNNGAIEEVRELLSKINNANREEIFGKYPIFKAIGAKEITLFLDGIYSFEQMKEVSKRDSRHYAKRQITWFNHQVATSSEATRQL